MPLLKVLVAEEDARIRDMLQRFIASCGFECDTAENRDQAAILLASVAFDLVAINVGFADAAGRPLYHEVIRLSPRPVLVLLESGNHPAHLEPAADLVLQEPHNLSALCTQLYRLLKSHLDGPHTPAKVPASARPAGSEPQNETLS